MHHALSSEIIPVSVNIRAVRTRSLVKPSRKISASMRKNVCFIRSVAVVFFIRLWAHGPLKPAPECGVHSYWSHRLSGWYRPPERRIWVGSERVSVWIKQLFRQEDEVEERHRYVIIIVFIISNIIRKHTRTLTLTLTHMLTAVPAEASGPSPSATSYWKFIARTHTAVRA